MKSNYEYATTTLVKTEGKPGKLVPDFELNTYAADGWELVNVVTQVAEIGTKRIAYLRREIE